jgi:hypothetical protein
MKKFTYFSYAMIIIGIIILAIAVTNLIKLNIEDSKREKEKGEKMEMENTKKFYSSLEYNLKTLRYAPWDIKSLNSEFKTNLKKSDIVKSEKLNLLFTRNSKLRRVISDNVDVYSDIDNSVMVLLSKDLLKEIFKENKIYHYLSGEELETIKEYSSFKLAIKYLLWGDDSIIIYHTFLEGSFMDEYNVSYIVKKRFSPVQGRGYGKE